MCANENTKLLKIFESLDQEVKDTSKALISIDIEIEEKASFESEDKSLPIVNTVSKFGVISAQMENMVYLIVKAADSKSLNNSVKA